jgi:hypothetical protein
MPNLAVLPIRDLVAEIRQAHEAAYGATRQALAHARQCGDLLIAAKADLPHGAWLPWLTEYLPEISERTAQGYMRIAREWVTLEAKSATVADLPLRDALKLLTPPRESFNSGDHEWYSPADYVEPARSVLGDFDLDPCSSQTANEIIRATAFFTADEDGLSRPWSGRLWMNPPYTNAAMNAFAAKLLGHYEQGDVTAAIMLTNNASDTGWFHALSANARGICFPRGRAHYWRGDTREQSSALQGQAIFYFGSRFDRFAGVFEGIGLVMTAASRTTALAARRELVGW